MFSCRNIVQGAGLVLQTLKPYTEREWRGRVVGLLCMMASVPLLIYLAKKIYAQFEQKGPYPPTRFSVPEDLPRSEPFQASIIAVTELETPFSIAEIPAEDGTSPFYSLPHELLCRIFCYATPSFKEWCILVCTCKKWHFLVTNHQESIGVKEVFKNFLQISINSNIDKICNLRKERNSPLSTSMVEQSTWNLIQDLNEHIVNQVMTLPNSILFPDENGPCIPEMQTMFETIFTQILPSDFLGKLLDMHDETNSDPETKVYEPVQKFLYNFPDQSLSFNTAAEIIEINRRDALGKSICDGKRVEKGQQFEIFTFASEAVFAKLIESYLYLNVILWFLENLISIKDHEQFSPKLFILGENFKKIKPYAKELQKQDGILARLLFSAMYALGWQNGECRHESNRLTPQTILLWIPDKVFDQTQLFLNDIKPIDEEAPKFMYGYSWHDFAAFLIDLDHNRFRLANNPFSYTPETLRKALEQGGATLYFDKTFWEIAFKDENSHSVYWKLMALGKFYKTHRKKWSSCKQSSIWKMLAFTTMDLLNWKSACETEFQVKSKKREPLSPNLQRVLKLELMRGSWSMPGSFYYLAQDSESHHPFYRLKDISDFEDQCANEWFPYFFPAV